MAESKRDRQKVTLIIIDILAFLTAFVTAMQVRFSWNPGIFEHGDPPWGPMLSTLPVMLAVWLVTLTGLGAYRLERRRLFHELGRIFQALLIMMGILMSVSFFYRGFEYSRGFTLLFLPLTLAATFFGRIAFRVGRARIEGVESFRNRVLLIGASGVAKHLAVVSQSDDNPLEVIGVLDDEVAPGTELEPGILVLGATKDLVEIAKKYRVHGVIVTDSKLDETAQLALLEQCLGANLEWKVVPSGFELMLDRAEIDVVAGVPVLGMRRSNIRGANRLFKRAFDIIVASIALLLLSPLMGLIAALIKLSSKGPVFFNQIRVGENGEPFQFIKFRSMHVNNDDSIHREYARKLITEGHAHEADGDGALYKIAKDPRLIPIGEFIRKYSIDELPQLLNVVKGDMSLIGPRPPIPYEVEVYRMWHKRRFEGPPGITGLWQVSGRNRLTFEEMVKLDIDYLENWSFGRDLKILWRTMGVVLFERAH